MKNIFAYNLDNLINENSPDGEVFITNKIDSTEKEIINNHLKSIAEAEKKYSMPVLLKVIRYIAFLVVVIFVRLILELIFEEISLNEAYNKTAFVFYLGIISCIIALLLFLYEKKKKKDYIRSEDFKINNEQSEIIIHNAAKAFGIPEDPRKIDVLTYRYNEKGGKTRIKAYKYAKYKNIEKYVYIKDDFLCFADIYFVISIPLDSLVDLKLVKRRTSITQWNKQESFWSKEYRKYKIIQNQHGFFTIKYYSLNINDPKGEFEIFIPNYDVEKFASLIGISTEKREKVDYEEYRF